LKMLRSQKHINGFRALPALLLCLVSACLLANITLASAHEKESVALRILQEWQGDYPISELHRLPEGQRTTRIGYLDNALQFSNVWQAFKPGEKVPEIDFSKHLAVFARNVAFYNRLAIMKVILKESGVEILARETMSALPIEDNVAMSIALILRAGVKYIKTGSERIPVAADGNEIAPDPLSAGYEIEGREIFLQNGRSEMAIAPDSATKIRTFVSETAVHGDLDSDGDDDAALLLVHDPGGSGIFYYVAVARNINGQYRGTNAVRLGDRIVPRDLQIGNGVIVARYAKRGSHEPMSIAPSVEALS